MKYKKKIYILLLLERDAVINKRRLPAVNPMRELLNMDNKTIIDKKIHVEVGKYIIAIDAKKQITNTIKNRNG